MRNAKYGEKKEVKSLVEASYREGRARFLSLLI